jgi:hypothetical protein
MKKLISFISVLLFSLGPVSYAAENAEKESSQKSPYWSYDLHDLYTKKVDNHGKGFEPLSDLRNLRVVLYGVLYRSGANNLYSKREKRDNKNPLPREGLNALCEQNFSKAFYLYPTNYKSSDHLITCQSEKGKNMLEYEQVKGLDARNENIFLDAIYKTIQEDVGHPILVHCWNGWHASGMVSTMALQQFCNFSPSEAKKYWIKNTDGNSQGYDKILKRIQNFKFHPEYKISNETRKKICPEIGSAKN